MSKFKAPDPAFAKRVRDSFYRQKCMHDLGEGLDLVEPGGVDIRLEFHQNLCQQHGFFHGGCIGAIADNAAGYASFSLMDADASVLTVEYKINFLAPARGARLVAQGRVVRSGRRVVVARADVYAGDDAGQTLCATAQGTFMVLAGTPDDARLDTALTRPPAG